MNVSKNLLLACSALLITGCTTAKQDVTVERKPLIQNTQENIHTTNTQKQKNIINTTKEIQVKEEIKLSKNEQEFLEVLKSDSYASLCNSKDKYEEYLQTNNKDVLKELFYEYTKNLANSCIDQKSFQKTLKKRYYKDKSQNYEVYNQKINKDELLEDFQSENRSVKAILNRYAPEHPSFNKLIDKLDKDSLSNNEYYKLRLNIERLKLVKDYNTNNFIQLNVPSYNFSFYENGQNVKEFGTIVGKNENQTPILSSKLSHFIINPTWNIPDSIAKKSIIPKALKDKNYLKKKNIVIRKNYRLSSKKINFKDVNWKKYLKDDVKYIPYKFIQMPSKTNGMGRVKFMFHNKYAVYMHDTIGSWRFKQDKEKIRSVSHGCVRLEHPRALMKHITQKYTPKTYQSVRSTFDKERTDSISLSKRLPVHITYLTAYTKDGKVKFYKDIYGYDKIQKLNFNPNS